MTVETWPLERIKPYERNPRKIPQSAVEKVAASIREFGWRQPIVVDEQGMILVGHTRRAAAEKLGQVEVPVHVAIGLTPAQAKAYRLADNRSNEEASWSDDLLALELADLKLLDFDLNLSGFDFGEIDKLFSRNGPDAVGVDETGKLHEKFQVLIDCHNEQEQSTLLERLDHEGYQCRALIS